MTIVSMVEDEGAMKNLPAAPVPPMLLHIMGGNNVQGIARGSNTPPTPFSGMRSQHPHSEPIDRASSRLPTVIFSAQTSLLLVHGIGGMPSHGWDANDLCLDSLLKYKGGVSSVLT